MIRLLYLAAFSFAIGGALYGFSLRHMRPEAIRDRQIKYLVYLLLVAGVMALGAAGGLWLALLVAAIVGVGATEITGAQRQAIVNGRPLPAWIWGPYATVSALAILGAALSDPRRALFVFAVIAAFDGACQVSGQLFGRTKLSPTVSPNKTVEGLIGGLIVGSATAAYMAPLSPAPAGAMALAALPMGFIALGGDLSKSWIKRRAGLKPQLNTSFL